MLRSSRRRIKRKASSFAAAGNAKAIREGSIIPILRNIRSYLVRNPQFFFMIAYVSLIPFSGIVYTLLPANALYAPYARLEPSAIADAEDVAQALSRAIHRSIDSQPRQEIAAGKWVLDLDSLQVDDVTASDAGLLSFRVRINADGGGGNAGGTLLGWMASVTLPVKPVSESLSSSGAQIDRIAKVDPSGYPSPFSAQNQSIIELLFETRPYGFASSTAHLLTLTGEQDSRFRRFVRGAGGDPNQFSDRLERMTYFSAVVITTLGLGDIVPMTPLARALVALEAIAGILLAGLFLNSLAQIAGGKAPPGASPPEPPQPNSSPHETGS